MSDVQCNSCGHSYSTDGNELEGRPPACPSSGSEIETSPRQSRGAETAIHPQLLRGLDMGDDSKVNGTDTSPVRSLQTTAIEPVETVASAGAPGDPEPAEPVLKGYLLRTGTVEPGPTIPLAGEKTVVGRVGANITVDDPTVSANHFEITVRGDDFFIRDLDSTHGTLLNGHRITSAQIKSHDVIRAGESEFLFTTMEVIPLR